MITRAQLTRMITDAGLLPHVGHDDDLVARIIRPDTFEVRFRSCLAFLILQVDAHESQRITTARLVRAGRVMENHAGFVSHCTMCWLRENENENEEEE